MLAILAAVMLAAAPQNDTVYTANGGRLVGTVVEETPQAVTIQLPDGTTRRLSRADVTRIEYADGSVSAPSRPAPPAPPPTYRTPPPQPSYPPQPPPPAYRPPPPAYGPPPYGPPSYPPQHRRGMPRLMPFWGSFGIGGSFPNGKAEGTTVDPTTGIATDVPIDQRLGSQLGLWFEGGARVTPHLGIGLYLDLGIGDPAGEAQAACSAAGTNCTASTGRFGVLLRHTFQPYASSTPWLAIGTGYEWADISADTYDYGSESILNYHGWEMLRLMAGVDLRTSPVFGVGLYGGWSFGRYTHADYHDGLGDLSIPSQATHWTIEAGLRFTLFP
jgi:hypothetical protein